MCADRIAAIGRLQIYLLASVRILLILHNRDSSAIRLFACLNRNRTNPFQIRKALFGIPGFTGSEQLLGRGILLVFGNHRHQLYQQSNVHRRRYLYRSKISTPTCFGRPWKNSQIQNLRYDDCRYTSNPVPARVIEPIKYDLPGGLDSNLLTPRFGALSRS
jgi:hypothetical protein